MGDCSIVTEKHLELMMSKYLGLTPGNLTGDEREILLFSLYMESVESGGVGARVSKAGDARLALSIAKQKLDAINAAEKAR